MAFGIDFHQKLEYAISNHKRILLGKSKFEFDNPETEKIVVSSYNELFDLKGILDCYDKPTLFEFKSGIISSTDYSNSYQIPFYFLICEILGIEVKSAYLIHYNQHNKNTDWVKIWNGKQQIEKAKNYIDSIGPEIYEYFTNNNIPLQK